MITVRAALTEAICRLRESGVSDPEREAQWLMAAVLECSAGSLRFKDCDSLTPNQQAAFEGYARRRAAREPIQYVLGTAEFLGLTLHVAPAVLIPRPDTETLVQAVAARLSGPVRVADVGTGSGAVAIGLALMLPLAQVVATDVSGDALTLASENAQRTGFAERIDFRQGDLVAPLANDGMFTAIVSNPPYIAEAEWATLMPEVREYEPRLALTPGPDGLWFYRRLATEAPPLLAPGGFLAVEVGIYQAEPVQALFRRAGLEVALCPDTMGVARVVVGRRSER